MSEPRKQPERPARADARRSLDALLEAALAVFSTSGVDAPVREIADRAGVGVATLYRHFPQRSDLVVAVFRNEVDACAEAAEELAEHHSPGEALTLWLWRFVAFVGAKRGLSAALHSGDSAYEALPVYFQDNLRPALQRLLDAAQAEGTARADVDPSELISAISLLCTPDGNGGVTEPSRRMVSLLIDGLHPRARA